MTKTDSRQGSLCKSLKLLLFPCMLLVFFFSCRDESFFERDPAKSKTIEDQLRSNPEYSKFVQALENTGLINYIGSSGLWTVYAPNNTALGNLDLNPTGQEEKVEFIKLLNYHIGIGLKYRSAVKVNDRLVTRSGKYVSLSRDPFSVDGVSYGQMSDVDANNGVIHELGQLLSPAPNGGEKLIELQEVGLFSDAVQTFAQEVFNPLLSIDRNFDGIIDDSVFVATYGLAVDIANENTRRTIFAPSDEAVEAYLTDKGLDSLEDLPTNELLTLLNKHILIDYKPSAVLTPGMTISTSGGTGSFTFDPAIVVTPDIQSSNAVIHIINKVLNH